MRSLFLWTLYGIILRSLLHLFVGIRYRNITALKKVKQFVLVANHNSHLDTVALMAVMPLNKIAKVHPIAAGDYFGDTKRKSRLTKFFVNALLIRRSSASKEDEAGRNPIRLMHETLKRGHSIILFPEGSRGEPEKMQSFKKGIGEVLKLLPDVPCLPVFLSGMGRALPKGEKLLIPYDCYVIFGEPIYALDGTAEEITLRIEEAVLKLKDQVPS